MERSPRSERAPRPTAQDVISLLSKIVRRQELLAETDPEPILWVLFPNNIFPEIETDQLARDVVEGKIKPPRVSRYGFQRLRVIEAALQDVAIRIRAQSLGVEIPNEMPLPDEVIEKLDPLKHTPGVY